MGVTATVKFDKEAIPDTIDETIQLLGLDILSESQKNLSEHNTIDRGTLLKSGKVIPRWLEAEISYPTPYALAIENGRTPGTMPPVNKLISWAERKQIAWVDEKGRTISPAQTGWMIAKKIQREGTKPQPFLMPAVETVKRKFMTR